ncbi:MAG: prolyl oligopeptidase family serine peptidase [Microcella sp.]|uniref:alpha/beta hydrolase family protein n=1 Tax=Microcella sp. TaxID=1913979 RepID=UPI0033150AF8
MPSGRGSWARASLAVAGAGLVVTGAAAVALAVSVARRVVTPPTVRPEDVRILSVDERAGTLTLAPTPETVVPGRYGMWFSRDTGYLRVGTVLSANHRAVVRRLERVVHGSLEGATTGRWSGWYYLRPEELGLPVEDVTVPTELGPAPAWCFPAEDTAHVARGGSCWAIHMHGRGVTRSEALRAVPVFHELGYTSLVISYRNDGEAPASPDGRYSLGDAEWRDLEAAVRFALEQGAQRILVMGWSMGGASTLQFVTRSEFSSAVEGIVLESPVVDWIRVLHAQAAQQGLPDPVRTVALGVLGSDWASGWAGRSEPIDFDRLDLVERAGELRTPTLILHSDGDTFVPIDGSLALARARPDLVRLERFATARHTRLWNYDARRWERAIRAWVSARG